MNVDKIAKFYGSMYGPEAGPWNLSLENKYLEYSITRFFEENFPVEEGAKICNVGIGAGDWDKYLSYIPNCRSLTSIDIDSGICETFAACLDNEENPNQVNIVNKDVMDCGEFRGRFDIVTMVGSTRIETGLFEGILKKLFSFLRPGGALYYQSLYDSSEDKAVIEDLCGQSGLRVEKYLQENAFNRQCTYWKIVRDE